MRIINKTTIPNDVLRAAVRAVCPSNVSKFTLTVTNANGYQFSGRACPGGNRVLVRVARTSKEAQLAYRQKTPGKGYIEGYNVGSRMEALLKVLAHELRHLWQAKVKRGWRVWGARGQFSERDADAYGIQMVRRYRRGELSDLVGVALGDCPKAKKTALKAAPKQQARPAMEQKAA